MNKEKSGFSKPDFLFRLVVAVLGILTVFAILRVLGVFAVLAVLGVLAILVVHHRHLL